jgi:branched-chain amino acid transport system ATP-binding protein
MLDVESVTAHYGRAQVLHGVSLAVAPGEVVALLGRNGAGKSTTMKSIMGLVRPSAGQVRFLGQSIAGREPFEIARAGIGYVPEERRVFTGLTVAENLEAGRRPASAGAEPWTIPRIAALFPSLGGMLDRRGGRMSGGEQQMVAIARSLMGNPRLLLLDEPSEGLAPVIVDRLAEALAGLKAAGQAVLLAEQNLRFAAALSDRAVVLQSGHPAWAGSMAALLGSAELKAQHLGLGPGA